MDALEAVLARRERTAIAHGVLQKEQLALAVNHVQAAAVMAVEEAHKAAVGAAHHLKAEITVVPRAAAIEVALADEEDVNSIIIGSKFKTRL